MKRKTLVKLSVYSIIAFLAVCVVTQEMYYQNIVGLQEDEMKALGGHITDLEDGIRSGIPYIGWKADIIVHHYDEDGHLIGYWINTASLTNTGRDWIEGKLYNSGFANASTYGVYIGTSESSDSYDDGWRILPDEITDSGLARALASYVDHDVGVCNVTKTFIVTGTKAVQKYGLYWDTNPSQSLIFHDTSSIKNVEDGHTLKVTFQLTNND